MRESQISRESSFSKGLGVLTWVLDHDGARADEIADGRQVPLSSAYRYLRTLREAGFVVEDVGAFSAGKTASGLLSGLPAKRLGELAAPFLEHLSSVTGETAVLTVRNGRYALCVHQVESRQQIRLAFRIGQLLPLHAGAGQRVLLAFAPEPVVRSVLEAGVRSYTPSTPTRDELPRLLARIRSERFAISRGELTGGSLALAVPVVQGQDVAFSLCVAGPHNRCTSGWRASARRELDAVAHSLEELLPRS